MFNFNKSLSIALIATFLIAIPIYLIEIEHSATTVLIVAFLVSLVSAGFASRSGNLRSNKKHVEENRTPYNQSQRENGSVKWFNASKGFGFITRDSGDDIFVHFRSIRGEGHRVLHDGQRVEFAISEGDKGLQAEDVAAAS